MLTKPALKTAASLPCSKEGLGPSSRTTNFSHPRRSDSCGSRRVT